MEWSLSIRSDRAFSGGFKEIFFFFVRLQTREIRPSLGSVQLTKLRLVSVSGKLLHWSYRGELLFGEDELEEVSVGDHKDDEEWEGEGDLLERLHNPQESKAKGLKNGEEDHPENVMRDIATTQGFSK